MNLHVIFVNYTAPLAEVEKVTADHRAWLDQHFQSGLFITSGPQDPRTGGLILARGESREQLLDLMQQDPFAKAGVADYTIVAFKPVKRSQDINLEGVALVQ